VPRSVPPEPEPHYVVGSGNEERQEGNTISPLVDCSERRRTDLATRGRIFDEAITGIQVVAEREPHEPEKLPDPEKLLRVGAHKGGGPGG
jgi:hypothetical protein